MKKFFNILRNFLAIVGLVSMVTATVGAYYVLKSYNLPPRILLEKALKKTRLSNSFLSELVAQKPIIEPGKQLPELSKDDWAGHGARRNRNTNPVTYDSQGFPIPFSWIPQDQFKQVLNPGSGRIISVNTSKRFFEALKKAEPGDEITITPGTYKLKSRSIYISRSGTALAPVRVRAEKLGDVILEMDTLEGFLIKAPFWIFENLIIKGISPNHNYCEHAFHIVGSGGRFILRNSRIHEFNAMIKANGMDDKNGIRVFPDGVLIEDNTFFNSQIRNTRSPVVFIDVVGADHWIVRGNIIANFSKGRGDKISTGAFLKGNSSHGVFENNLVIGEYSHSGGTRIGLSLGGGGTSIAASRDNDRTVEHTRGLVRNNVVMNCSDVGLYLNKAKGTVVLNNLFYRTMGIDVRFDQSTAEIRNNILDGKIRDRDGGTFIESHNLMLGGMFQKKPADIFKEPARGNFNLKEGSPVLSKGVTHPNLAQADFCGNPLGNTIHLGPFVYNNLPHCTLLDFSGPK